MVEIAMSMTITAMLAGVLGAMLYAAQTAWTYTAGLNTIQPQARVTFERINYMVSQAGTYQVSGQPVRAGIAVVTRSVGGQTLPQILVIWSGGRTGGVSAAGLQTRLPVIQELVIYAPDPADPADLIELAPTANSSSIDFSAADFSTKILAIVDAPTTDKVQLCDRLRRANLSGAAGNVAAGNVRFEASETPSAADLAGMTPGTSAWNNLMWAQGIVASDSGMRQCTIRIELQLEPAPGAPVSNGPSPTAIPFFGSASFRYVYRP